MTPTESGWYVDPKDAGRERFWDGSEWTTLQRSKGYTSAPSSSDTTAQGGTDETLHAATQRKISEYRSSADAARKQSEAIVASAARGAGQIICPHCQTKGQVGSKQIRQKKGVSGGKATAAVFTAGISMLGTGLSRKEKVTEMHCRNCGTTWHV